MHCTLKRIDIKSSYDYYILYLEFLGGLIPLLSARKSSKVKPEFVIFDPFLARPMHKINEKSSKQAKKQGTNENGSKTQSANTPQLNTIPEISLNQALLKARSINSLDSESSYFTIPNFNETNKNDPELVPEFDELETDEELSLDTSLKINQLSKKSINRKPLFSKLGQKKKTTTAKSKSKSHKIYKNKQKASNAPNSLTDSNAKSQLTRASSTKSSIKKMQSSRLKRSVLVNINSNLWGTRFKFVGQRYLPAFTGQIVYKTSLFHLQPRQMTITLEDLTSLNKKAKPLVVKQVQIKAKTELVKKTVLDVAKSATQSVETPLKNTKDIVPSSLKQKLSNYTKLTAADTTVSSVTGGLRSSIASASLLDMNYFIKLRLAASSYAKLNTELSPSTASLTDLDQIRSSCSGATELVDAQLNKLNSQVDASLSTLTNSDSSISNSSNSVACLQAETSEFILPKLTLSTTNSLYECRYDEERIEPGCYLITSSTGNADQIEPLLVNSVVETEHKYIPPKMSYSAALKSPSSTRFSTRIDLILNYLRSRRQLQFLFENGGMSSETEHLDSELKLNPSRNQEECSVNLEIIKSSENEKNSEYEDIDEASVVGATITGEQQDTTAANKKTGKKGALDLLGKRKNLIKKFRSKNGSVKSPDAATSTNSKNKVFCKSDNNHIVLHNKPPIWNETSQVYQLDFGGRVTQESAKNFQIEHNGRQVMQFGRIDTNAYTLDFQWPFSTVQAFSIALANITQRLK